MKGLSVFELTKKRKGFEVHTSFDVAPGEVLALMGPSGCGKSTVLRMIAGLESADSGRAVLDGDTRWEKLAVQKRRVGYLAQDLGLFDTHTVGENVAFAPKMRGVALQDRMAEAAQLLERVGLAGFSGRGVGTLSGGERQRVALARVFAARPRVLLLDEPFAALDAALRRELETLVLAFAREHQIPAVIVTHDELFNLGRVHRLLTA